MEYRVLGPVEATSNGTAFGLGARQRALLARLLIDANRVVSTDRIIDELWHDAAQDRHNALWVVISRLRSALEPERTKRTDGTVLVSKAPGYRLEELYLMTTEDRIEADLRSGRDRTLISELDGLVLRFPTRERLISHLMEALDRSDRQTEALRVCAAYRTRLADELGIAPSVALCRQEERLLRTTSRSLRDAASRPSARTALEAARHS